MHVVVVVVVVAFVAMLRFPIQMPGPGRSPWRTSDPAQHQIAQAGSMVRCVWQTKR